MTTAPDPGRTLGSGTLRRIFKIIKKVHHRRCHPERHRSTTMNKNFGHHIRLCWRFQSQTIRSPTPPSFRRSSLPAHRHRSSLSTTQMQSATFSTQTDERSLSRTTSEKVAEEQGRQDMRWLLESMSGSREVSYWLEHYSTPPEDSTAVNNLAVIKVGGGVVEDDAQLNDLCSSLAFLKRSGLNPIVIHGAGPQLNADLTSQGIVSDYIEGIRITTPEILRTARRVFLDVNRKLVDALEARGTRARFIDPSVFEADFVDQKHYGLVGEIKKVRHEWIGDAIDSGYLPVVCSLAESDTGQTLNVNADVAAVRLAEVMVPMKMIYINTMGGLLDGDDQLMRNINYPSDYEWLLAQPWLRHGTKLKVVEINELLDILPPSSSVSVTSPENLMRELFTHKGCGTLCRKETKINVYEDMSNIDISRLKSLLKKSFHGRSPVEGYLENLDSNIHRIYLADNYEGAVILTKETGIDTPYMDKFAVSKLMQGTGTGKALWNRVIEDEPRLWWRSRKGNPVNSWYHEVASELAWDLSETWRIYSYGYDLHNQEEYAELKKAADAATLMRPTIQSEVDGDDTTEDTTAATGGGNVFRSTTAAQAPFNVGLVGARGYVGAELIRLVSDHPSMTLKVASSRALEGQNISTIIDKQKRYGGASSWTAVPSDQGGLDEELAFVNIGPADAASPLYEDIDLWFLALPNGLAEPFVKALVDDDEGGTGQKKKVIVDLSADHRFLCGLPDLSVGHEVANPEEHRWTYGLPERFRKELSASTDTLLVANPGCYATGAQMGLYPLALNGTDGTDGAATGKYGLASGTTPNVFGVSGYSGAGTNPSDKNNPIKLENNLMPYSLSNHIHEREIGQFIGRKVHFMPHVASHFRGISLTVSMELDQPCHDANELYEQYVEYYRNDPLIRVMKGIPEVAWNAGGHHVVVGGFTVSECGRRAVVCVTMDNLLKGAATQALANGNLGLGLEELAGIHVPFVEEERRKDGGTTTAWEMDNTATAAAHHAFCAP